MKTRKNRGKRAAAAALGTLLVLTLLMGISTVTGNPFVSAVGARRAVRYAARTYGIEDAAVSSMRKDGAGSLDYWYAIVCAHSQDTVFLVRVPLLGEITEDNYDYAVTRLHNTRDRLGRELAAAALDALKGTAYDGMVQECSAQYGYLLPDSPETFPNIPFRDAFTLDMPFDAGTITVPTLLQLTLVGDGASQAELERILPEIKAAMEQSGLCFDYYTVRYERPDASCDSGNLFGIYGVEKLPKENIS